MIRGAYELALAVHKLLVIQGAYELALAVHKLLVIQGAYELALAVLKLLVIHMLGEDSDFNGIYKNEVLLHIHSVHSHVYLL